MMLGTEDILTMYIAKSCAFETCRAIDSSEDREYPGRTSSTSTVSSIDDIATSSYPISRPCIHSCGDRRQLVQ